MSEAGVSGLSESGELASARVWVYRVRLLTSLIASRVYCEGLAVALMKSRTAVTTTIDESKLVWLYLGKAGEQGGCVCQLMHLTG